jgi:hypothetical protein
LVDIPATTQDYHVVERRSSDVSDTIQDLYETEIWTIELLGMVLKSKLNSYAKKINIMNPCCGPSAIMERVLTDETMLRHMIQEFNSLDLIVQISLSYRS